MFLRSIKKKKKRMCDFAVCSISVVLQDAVHHTAAKHSRHSTVHEPICINNGSFHFSVCKKERGLTAESLVGGYTPLVLASHAEELCDLLLLLLKPSLVDRHEGAS